MGLLGIDFGEKRVGVASTDESGVFALPRMVLPNDEHLLNHVLKLLKKFGAEKIIMGESKNLDGTPNPINKDINKFAEDLRAAGVEVVLHNEVFTSQEAERLQGKNSMIDASAAAIILKSYIDTYNR
ncbi:Holliday junction resolvase RuvX [Candidatus Parcubacteria bacterium]|nr:Holliday junction resolvase RuvX [Candidatus Parcubacteria bacterium]